MNEWLIRIEDKVDKLGEHLSNIDSTLAVQAEQLKTHIYRTDQNEMRIEKIEKYTNFLNAFWKICAAVAGITGFIFGALKIVEFFSGK